MTTPQIQDFDWNPLFPHLHLKLLLGLGTSFKRENVEYNFV